MTLTEVAIVCVPLLIPLTMLALIARDTWRSIQPSRLMLRGEFAAARAAANDVGQSWMRWLPGVRPTTPYMIAVSHHLEGDLDEAAKILKDLDRGEHGALDENMTYATRSLEAANLVLQQSDPERVLRLLTETSRSARFARDELMAAIALLALDRRDEAEKHFRAAGTVVSKPEPKLGKVVLLWNGELESAMFHTLRGMYLRQTGRETEAVEALLRATSGPKTNVYVEGARRLLADTSLAAPDENEADRAAENSR